MEKPEIKQTIVIFFVLTRADEAKTRRVNATVKGSDRSQLFKAAAVNVGCR